jgi:hypothetical protein
MRRRREPTALSRKLVAAVMKAGWQPYADPDRYVISRVYAGHWQRSAGAWSWSLDHLSDDTNAKVDASLVGSQFPAAECARGCQFVGDALWPSSVLSPTPNERKREEDQ